MTSIKQPKQKHRIKKTYQSFMKQPSQQLASKDYYITFHNKLNVEHQNRQFKSIYVKLNAAHEPKDQYKMLYHIDIVHVVNKILREYIINKELSMNFSLNTLITKAQHSIDKIYNLFILDESVTNDQKKINFQYQSYMNAFFNVVITFHMKICIINLMQNKIENAKRYYESLYKIVTNITTSLTSNYKLLRKIGQFLITYAVFMINSSRFGEAIDLLFEALKNETNILIILVWRGKSKSKMDLKRRKIQLYNRLFAIFLNLSNCFLMKSKIQWSYICLRECKLIAELKENQLCKDIKLLWPDLLKKYKNLYNQYIEMKTIIQTYFNQNQLIQVIAQCKKYQISKKVQNIFQSKVVENSSKSKDNSKEHIKGNKDDKMTIKVIKETRQTHSTNPNQDSIMINSKNKKDLKAKSFKNIKRSMSLQQNIIMENNKRLLKDFGQEILFLGVNLFDKNIFKKHKSISAQVNSHVSKSSFRLSSKNIELKSSYLIKEITNNQPAQTKLKKKQKKIENKLFKKIEQPLSYQEVEKKIVNFWNQQSLQNNKTKQKRCLLQYKNQYLNSKEITKENTNINDQIKIINKKDFIIYKENKVNEIEQEQKEKGINLFKMIILKNMKMIDIKKNQGLISILKKKRQVVRTGYSYCSYSEPQLSIDYLVQKIKKQKNREELIQRTRNEEKIELIELNKYKSTEYNHTFLTKNTQIPNLFLSYISSSGFSGQALKGKSNMKQNVRNE